MNDGVLGRSSPGEREHDNDNTAPWWLTSLRQRLERWEFQNGSFLLLFLTPAIVLCPRHLPRRHSLSPCSLPLPNTATYINRSQRRLSRESSTRSSWWHQHPSVASRLVCWSTRSNLRCGGRRLKMGRSAVRRRMKNPSRYPSLCMGSARSASSLPLLAQGNRMNGLLGATGHDAAHKLPLGGYTLRDEGIRVGILWFYLFVTVRMKCACDAVTLLLTWHSVL